MSEYGATAFAEMERETSSAEDMLQLVSFKLGREEFAVDILLVQEINRMAEITPVPKALACVEGVINLRGKIIPVVNLRKRFGLECGQATGDERIVVVNVENRVLGLVVDSVSEVLRVPVNTIEPPPSLVAGIGSEYVKGVGKIDERLLILLDLAMVLGTTKEIEAVV
jgi:purine-binding chemotaxis protein CheW